MVRKSLKKRPSKPRKTSKKSSKPRKKVNRKSVKRLQKQDEKKIGNFKKWTIHLTARLGYFDTAGNYQTISKPTKNLFELIKTKHVDVFVKELFEIIPGSRNKAIKNIAWNLYFIEDIFALEIFLETSYDEEEIYSRTSYFSSDAGEFEAPINKKYYLELGMKYKPNVMKGSQPYAGSYRMILKGQKTHY